MAVVELKGVSKQFGSDGAKAVDNFNLVTRDGEFVVLVGPSGCGKTTTMRMIAGLEQNSEGEIRIAGKDVSGMAPKDRDIAMVFQSYALYPHMTVYGNMAFSLKLKKYTKAEIDKQVTEAARVLDIEHLLDRKPRALSGGQRQRVALGRAIVRQPQVFLMDEPLSNLDAKLRVDMRAEIVKLHRKLGVTTFYVTHDQTEAMTMGQRIAVLRDGLIQQVDTPNNLYDHPANMFVAGFIGTPSMNFLKASVDAGEDRMVGEGFSLAPTPAHRSALDKAGGEVWVGVRPEHLHLQAETPAADDNVVRGRVEVVEPLGAVTLIQVRVGQVKLTAQIEPHQRIAMGDDVALRCASEQLYLFDTVSEAALLPGAPDHEPAAASG
ncbi:ABC transporter ATP-binding protein [Salinisphaera aquimarina]|uniref:ABC transporter ATP-binding protein n=1 Tax=Salinisphaera aquimarina TaxID=2094031 RepID=A0ABV7EKN9_9GAMM